MSVMASRPAVRWAVPAGVLVAVLGAAVLSNSLRASASVTLPDRTPAQLLVDVAQANLTGMSGTVTERADLGLPALPNGVGGQGSANLNALVAGSHTLRVWYSGPDKVRIALIGALDESDVIRNGSDAWIWSSSDNSATHFTIKSDTAGGNGTGRPKLGLPLLPSGLPSGLPSALPSGLPFTPEQAAGLALGLLSPTTVVSTEPSEVVAGRPAYLLSVAPKDNASLIDKIVIAIDGTEHVPTRFEVFSKGHPDSAAFSIGFSQVNFTRPDDERFAFTPPPGTKVTEGNGTGAASPAKPSAPPKSSGTAAPKTATIGTGWTTVLAARVPATPDTQAGTDKSTPNTLDTFLKSLPQVHGSWGSGRLLQSRLFSVLITDDGRILAGAVAGDRLESAAADPAAQLK
jgi:outer membrane lipoprotein-sorting protein